MRLYSALLLSALCTAPAAAFVLNPQCRTFQVRKAPSLPTRSAAANTVLFAKKKANKKRADQGSAPPPSEPEVTAPEPEVTAESERTITSFDDAGRSLVEEEDQQRMELMGDFDTNPEYKTDSIEKMRAAIRERASDLGVEKSKVSQQYIEDAKARATQNVGNSRPAGSLDLSQISTGDEPKVGGSMWDEDMPTMLYDPADELTDEEQKEVDKVGQLPFYEQAWTELQGAKWPDLGSAGKEVVLMIVVIALSGLLIIGWDKTLRNAYTSFGFIPTKDDIPGQLEGLDLPDGFTNNMNENDMASLTDEMNQAGNAAGIGAASVEQAVESLKSATLEDL